jgi:hypothetical protein
VWPPLSARGRAMPVPHASRLIPPFRSRRFYGFNDVVLDIPPGTAELEDALALSARGGWRPRAAGPGAGRGAGAGGGRATALSQAGASTSTG